MLTLPEHQISLLCRQFMCLTLFISLKILLYFWIMYIYTIIPILDYKGFCVEISSKSLPLLTTHFWINNIFGKIFHLLCRKTRRISELGSLIQEKNQSWLNNLTLQVLTKGWDYNYYQMSLPILEIKHMAFDSWPNIIYISW